MAVTQQQLYATARNGGFYPDSTQMHQQRVQQRKTSEMNGGVHVENVGGGSPGITANNMGQSTMYDAQSRFS